MIFTSLSFFYFFLIVLVFYFLIPHKFRWVYLLIASFWFYGYHNIWNISYLAIPTLLVYVFSIGIDNSNNKKTKKKYLFGTLLSSLSILIYFKYTNFLYYSITILFSPDTEFKGLDIILPFGISFFTFKLVSYSIDVYNEKIPAERHLGYFALYISFFPQLLMGPIERAVNFIPELKKKVNFDFDRVISGLTLISWGVFKKMVIADRLAIFVNEIFAAPYHQGINLLFAVYFYAFQIYCDFSGYSDIAIGIARILGFKSMKNFNFPYFATNMTQFWNRWHISLSTWLRDYLFLPIAYSSMRKIPGEKKWGIKTEYIGYASGMFITMFLGGLWHGAAWTFVIWGMLHGLFLIIGYTTKKARKKILKKTGLKKFKTFNKFMGIFMTFNFVSFAWIFFRSESFSDAYNYISSFHFSFASKGSEHLIFNVFLVLVFITLEIIYMKREKIKFIRNSPMLVKTAVFALFICIIILFSLDSSNEFIYLRF